LKYKEFSCNNAQNPLLLRLRQPCYNPDVNMPQPDGLDVIDRLAELIQDHCRQRAPSWRNIIIGLGDRAAVWQTGSEHPLADIDRQGWQQFAPLQP
jgi:hypothetical protein